MWLLYWTGQDWINLIYLLLYILSLNTRSFRIISLSKFACFFGEFGLLTIVKHMQYCFYFYICSLILLCPLLLLLKNINIPFSEESFNHYSFSLVCLPMSISHVGVYHMISSIYGLFLSLSYFLLVWWVNAQSHTNLRWKHILWIFYISSSSVQHIVSKAILKTNPCLLLWSFSLQCMPQDYFFTIFFQTEQIESSRKIRSVFLNEGYMIILTLTELTIFSA